MRLSNDGDLASRRPERFPDDIDAGLLVVVLGFQPTKRLDGSEQCNATARNARARTTEGEERLRLWKKALEFWPLYADYQLKTEREIPVVVLDPVQ